MSSYYTLKGYKIGIHNFFLVYSDNIPNATIPQCINEHDLLTYTANVTNVLYIDLNESCFTTNYCKTKLKIYSQTACFFRCYYII